MLGCDCTTCQNQCNARQTGFGYTPAGFGAAPLVIGAVKLAPLLVSAIGKLFGAAPRGEFQKFKRTAYPYMAALAKESGIPVYIFWFGEAVGVNPNGSFGVVYHDGAHYETQLLNAGLTPFYAATCPHSDCVNKPADLGFQLYDPDGVAGADNFNIERAGSSFDITSGSATQSAAPSSIFNSGNAGVSAAGFAPSNTNQLLLYGALAGLAFFAFKGKK